MFEQFDAPAQLVAILEARGYQRLETFEAEQPKAEQPKTKPVTDAQPAKAAASIVAETKKD